MTNHKSKWSKSMNGLLGCIIYYSSIFLIESKTWIYEWEDYKCIWVLTTWLVGPGDLIKLLQLLDTVLLIAWPLTLLTGTGTLLDDFHNFLVHLATNQNIIQFRKVVERGQENTGTGQVEQCSGVVLENHSPAETENSTTFPLFSQILFVTCGDVLNPVWLRGEISKLWYSTVHNFSRSLTLSIFCNVTTWSWHDLTQGFWYFIHTTWPTFECANQRHAH